jgi:hypothetical protein
MTSIRLPPAVVSLMPMKGDAYCSTQRTLHHTCLWFDAGWKLTAGLDNLAGDVHANVLTFVKISSVIMPLALNLWSVQGRWGVRF